VPQSASSKRPHAIGVRVGKRAADVAEKFAPMDTFGQRLRVGLYQSPSVALGHGMDGMRNLFFTGSGANP